MITIILSGMHAFMLMVLFCVQMNQVSLLFYSCNISYSVADLTGNHHEWADQGSASRSLAFRSRLWLQCDPPQAKLLDTMPQPARVLLFKRGL